MDDRTGWLFDPTAAHDVVLARRPAGGSVVDDVVSDVVWRDVVRLLRWASADARGATSLEAGAWWRLAAGSADLLRRMPGLCAEIAEPWGMQTPASAPEELPAADRIALVAGRLAALVRSPVPVPLRALAAEIDALGEAAISALAERSFGGTP
jgi:hypothetical protein